MVKAPNVLCLLFLAIGHPMVNGDNFKIFNGNEVEPHSRPWMTHILDLNTGKVLCGGALVHEKFVLTAASCLQVVPTPSLLITLGDHTRSTADGTEQECNPAAITQHPSFNNVTYENDIAMIELSTSVNVSGDAVSVIPVLPNDGLTDRIYDKHCRVSGWGYQTMGSGGEVSDQSDVLLEVTVEITRRRDCIDEGAPSDTAVCYEPLRDPTSVTCEGDVGGPLVCKRKKVWHVTGVVTGFESTDGCATGLKAATKITSYIDWIAEVISGA